MTTIVTDSVMDLDNVQQDITLKTHRDPALSRQSRMVGLDTPTLDDEATSKQYVDNEIETALAKQVPAGMGPLAWSGTTAPEGWLMCDGASYDSVTDTDLEALYLVIGTRYGGTGPADFKVPDMQGRFPLGLNDTGSGTKRVNRTHAQNLGGNDGQENYELQLTHLPSHNHTATISSSGQHGHTGATTSSDGNHDHSFTYGTVSVDGDGDAPYPTVLTDSGSTKTTDTEPSHDHTVTVPSNANSKHSHPVSIGYTAGASAHENTPPFLTINYIIKF